MTINGGDLGRAASAAVAFYCSAFAEPTPPRVAGAPELEVHFNPWLALSWVRVDGRQVHVGSESAWSATDPTVAVAPALQQLAERFGTGQVNATFFGPSSWAGPVSRALRMGFAGGVHFSRSDTCPESLEIKGLVMQLIDRALAGDAAAAQVELQRVRRRLDDPLFRVAVVATMSSGKSTLINALLGEELLPVANAATTAKLCIIEDRDGMHDFRAKAIGSGGEVLDERVATRDLLEAWNDDDGIQRIEIVGDIRSVANLPHGRLVLVDTPGPNSANNARHKVELEEFLFADHAERPDLVLYVLDATRVETDDDHALLQRVSGDLTNRDPLIRDRLVFAFNRANLLDPEREPLPPRLAAVRRYLSGILHVDQPSLQPVDARGALLLARRLSGQGLTRREQLFPSMSRATASSLASPPHWLRRLGWVLMSPERAADEELLVRTGVPEIKKTLGTWLGRTALDLRIREALGALEVAGRFRPPTGGGDSAPTSPATFPSYLAGERDRRPSTVGGRTDK